MFEEHGQLSPPLPAPHVYQFVENCPPVHDGLQNRSKGRDPDASAYQHCMLCMEDLAGRSTEGTVDEHMERFVDLSDVDIVVILSLAACPVKVVGAVFLRYSVKDEVV